MDKEIETLHAIFNQVMKKYSDRMTPGTIKAPTGAVISVYLIDDYNQPYNMARELNDMIYNAGLSNKWVARAGPWIRKHPERGTYLEIVTSNNYGCPACCNDSVLFSNQGASE